MGLGKHTAFRGAETGFAAASGVDNPGGARMMTTYRTVQGIRNNMVNLQQALRSAFLADSTNEMGRHATEAMAIVDEMLRTLRTDESGSDAGEGDQADQTLLQSAERALTQAWDRAEKVTLATSLPEMRERLLDFKTLADFADAYVSAALGTAP
jgi:hypothetical protein